MTPESLPEPIAVARLIADHFSRRGIRYVIGGSFASSIHGEPRSTNDVDIVADLHDSDVDPVVGALGQDCYISRDAVAEAVRTGGTFNIVHVPTAVKVDVFVAGGDAFDRERLARRTPVRLTAGSDAIDLFVDTAENTILRKLEWYRRGGETSERQWRDVAGIVKAQSSRLDRAYLEEWAARLGVVDLLARSLDVA